MTTFEIKTICLALAFFAPFSWCIALVMGDIIKNKSKRFLFFLMLAASFVYMMTFAKFLGNIKMYTFLFPLQAFAVLYLFPGFYFYILSLTQSKIEYNLKFYVHFLAPLLFFLVHIFIHTIWMSNEEELTFMKSILASEKLSGIKYQTGFYVYRIGKMTYMLLSILYLFLIFRSYTKHKDRIKNIFSSNQAFELKWIRGIVITFILVVIFNLIIHYLRNYMVAQHDLLIAISYFIFASFFWVLGLNGYTQKEIYNAAKIEMAQSFDDGLKINKRDIIQYMDNKKPYLKTDINVFDFCYHFKTNRTYISSVINKGFDMNFRAFINSYRIKEAKLLIQKKLQKENSVYLENIAINVGFNSYNTFLRVFKTHEKITPKEFVEKMKSHQPGG